MGIGRLFLLDQNVLTFLHCKVLWPPKTYMLKMVWTEWANSAQHHVTDLRILNTGATRTEEELITLDDREKAQLVMTVIKTTEFRNSL